MRSDFRMKCAVLALLSTVTTSAFAGVITIGRLADATSARVVALALKERSDAQHPQRSMLGPGAGPGGMLITNPSGAASTATILRVSQMGGRAYGVVRSASGEVEDMPVGQTGENGLTVRAQADGTYGLINDRGEVLTTYNPNGPAQPQAQAGAAHGTFLLPMMGSSSQQHPAIEPQPAPPIAPTGTQQ